MLQAHGRLSWTIILHSPPTHHHPPPPFLAPHLSFPHTGVSRFSSLGDGGTPSPSFVKLVDWLGLAELSPASGPLGRAGRVEQRPLALEPASRPGGPLSMNSSLGERGLGSVVGGLAGGDWSTCVGESGVFEKDRGLDVEGARGMCRGSREPCADIC